MTKAEIAQLRAAALAADLSVTALARTRLLASETPAEVSATANALANSIDGLEAALATAKSVLGRGG